MKVILYGRKWKTGITKIVNKIYLNMFPHTTEMTKISVDQSDEPPVNDMLSVTLCRYIYIYIYIL